MSLLVRTWHACPVLTPEVDFWHLIRLACRFPSSTICDTAPPTWLGHQRRSYCWCCPLLVCRAARTQPIIVNATAEMLKEHLIPVAMKLREQALDMEKEEEEYHIEMRRVQHRKDSGEVEIAIQEVCTSFPRHIETRRVFVVNSLDCYDCGCNSLHNHGKKTTITNVQQGSTTDVSGKLVRGIAGQEADRMRLRILLYPHLVVSKQDRRRVLMG